MVSCGPLETLNRAVDGLIAGGHYTEALELPGRFVERGSRDSASELLVQINLSRPQYNLGRWGPAWDRLRGLDPLAAAFPLERAGLAQQRACHRAPAGRRGSAL